eukprot:GGOE01010131.1.p2 GENE.GGOE01010131.1~~GGOE01010131.1.p2  ORF type:complete len:127 (+),score=6.92 GGOE01010131.1:100-480(+)
MRTLEKANAAVLTAMADTTGVASATADPAHAVRKQLPHMDWGGMLNGATCLPLFCKTGELHCKGEDRSLLQTAPMLGNSHTAESTAPQGFGGGMLCVVCVRVCVLCVCMCVCACVCACVACICECV